MQSPFYTPLRGFGMVEARGSSTRTMVAACMLAVLMFQLGIHGSLNAWFTDEQTLESTPQAQRALGSESTNFTANIEGEDLALDQPMAQVMFRYNASAVGQSSSGMTYVTNASCSVSPALPTGLSFNVTSCTIGGAPTVQSINTTHTVRVNISNSTFETTIWFSVASQDTDGDGVCDGLMASITETCTAGPDAFPLDSAAYRDTDADGLPDELTGDSVSQPPLIEDLDDDGDTWGDYDEFICGTDSKDRLVQPTDTDGDGSCDTIDETLDLPFTVAYTTQYLDLIVNQSMTPLLPVINGSGEVTTWELDGELPDGLVFGWGPARVTGSDGSLSGTPSNTTEEAVTLVVWANNSVYQQSFSMSLTVYEDRDNDSLPDDLPDGYLGNLTLDTDDDNDGYNDSMETTCGSDPYSNQSDPFADPISICLNLGEEPVREEGINWIWCFPGLLLLLLVLLLPMIFGRNRLLMMMEDESEPEQTISTPAID